LNIIPPETHEQSTDTDFRTSPREIVRGGNIYISVEITRYNGIDLVGKITFIY